MARHLILTGTRKGAWIAEGNKDRSARTIKGVEGCWRCRCADAAMIRVILPGQREDYTNRLREVELDLPMSDYRETTLADVIAALESRFGGVAFRSIDEQGNIRRHTAIFIGESMVRTLRAPVRNNPRVQIVGALSDG